MVLAVMEHSFLSLSHTVAASFKESALAGRLCWVIYSHLRTEIRGLAGNLLTRRARFFISWVTGRGKRVVEEIMSKQSFFKKYK